MFHHHFLSERGEPFSLIDDAVRLFMEIEVSPVVVNAVTDEPRGCRCVLLGSTFPFWVLADECFVIVSKIHGVFCV